MYSSHFWSQTYIVATDKTRSPVLIKTVLGLACFFFKVLNRFRAIFFQLLEAIFGGRQSSDRKNEGSRFVTLVYFFIFFVSVVFCFVVFYVALCVRFRRLLYFVFICFRVRCHVQLLYVFACAVF